jgi:cytochrome c-type biogenesis protein CcmH
MILFIVLAAVLAATCVAVVAVPLMRPVPSRAATAPWAALGAAAVLLVGSAALYPTWSNWSWRKSPGIGSPEGMVERLIHRLNAHPDDVAGWLMLGRSYVVLQEYPLAVRAYTRADHAAGGRSADALVGEAEALSLMNNSEITGTAARLIEQALVIDPSDPRALFFGAAAALHQGDLPLARARFTKLLALNPPPRVKAILEQEISGIDRQLASAPPKPSTPKP